MTKIIYDLPEQRRINTIREYETNQAINFFPNKKLRVLEIGGGDGFVAKLIASKGFDIISIDLQPRYPQHFPVKVADGIDLDFPDNSFDIVFTCQVFQSVENIPLLCNEIRRVLDVNGVSINIVPSRFWAIITSFWFYPKLPKNLLKFYKKSRSKTKQNNNQTESEPKRKSKLFKYLLFHPIGPYQPTFLHEIIFFSAKKWEELFKKNGFEEISHYSGPLLYSAHGIFQNKGWKLRKKLSGGAFTSSYCFIMKPKMAQDIR